MCSSRGDFCGYCPHHSNVEGEDPGNEVVALSIATFLSLLCSVSFFFNKLALLRTFCP